MSIHVEKLCCKIEDILFYCTNRHHKKLEERYLERENKTLSEAEVSQKTVFIDAVNINVSILSFFTLGFPFSYCFC